MFGECSQFLRKTCWLLQAFAKQTELKKKNTQKKPDSLQNKSNVAKVTVIAGITLLTSPAKLHTSTNRSVLSVLNLLKPMCSWEHLRDFSQTICQLLQMEITKLTKKWGVSSSDDTANKQLFKQGPGWDVAV